MDAAPWIQNIENCCDLQKPVIKFYAISLRRSNLFEQLFSSKQVFQA